MSRPSSALITVGMLLLAGLAATAQPVQASTIPSAVPSDPFAATRQALVTHAGLIGNDPVAQARIQAALAALDLASRPDALSALGALLDAQAVASPLPREKFDAAARVLDPARGSSADLADGAALARSFADAFGDDSPATKANLAALDAIAALHGARLGPARALAIAAQQEADVGIGDASSPQALLSLVGSEPAANAAPEVQARYALQLAKARAGPRLDVGQWQTARDVLDAAADLRDASARGPSLAEATRLSLAAQPVPASTHTLPALPAFASFADAAVALHVAHGERAAPELLQAAQRVDRDAPTVGHALARLVAAQLLAEEAASSPFAAIDVGFVAAARNLAATEVAAAMPELACTGDIIPPNDVLVVDLVCVDSTYTSDVPLTIDAGGNDVYENRAGGALGPGAAMLVDLEGDDAHMGPSPPTNGAGRAGGFGFLFDGAGNDSYWCSDDCNGAAYNGGSGLLIDASGDDSYGSWQDFPLPYAVNGAANGASGLTPDGATRPNVAPGLGMLVDLAGNDQYAGGNGFANQGAEARVTWGTLVDASGSDVYTARTLGGGNGAGAGNGAGVLVDGGGDDIYQGTNGGGTWQGVGILADLAGNDSYAGLNGYGLFGSGFLCELGGDDSYAGLDGSATNLNSNAVAATGFLFDAAGDDQYVGASDLASAVIGSGETSGASGFLLDAAGADTYASVAYYPGHVGVGSGVAGGLGALVDLEGDDLYSGDGDAFAGSGAGDQAGGTAAGVLYDGAGNDQYLSTARAGNGGAYSTDATALSAGALFDEGGNDFYSTTGAAGNGGARAGAALLVDTVGDDVYSVLSGGDAAANGGAATGSGLLADLAGNDVYSAHGGNLLAANGGAEIGTAFLFDAMGDDTYDATAAAFLAGNGGGSLGAGFLWDAAGSDQYRAASERVASANGGGYLGAGFLADLAGNDLYDATAGTFGGLNGGGDAGIGMLVDQAGDDTYAAVLSSVGGANGGATTGGVGLLLDGAGSNSFTATAAKIGGLNGAATGYPFLDAAVTTGGPETEAAVPIPGGIALLVGGSGDDRYESNGVGQGAGDLYGVGVLVDSGGANTFTALPGSLAQGAGRLGGLGLLIDRGVASSFTLQDAATGQGAGLQGVGLLLQTALNAITTYVAAPTASPAVEAGGGIGMRVASGASAILGVAPSVECRDSAELRRVSQPLVMGRQLEVRVCHVDASTSQRLRDPTTGEELDDITKPVVPCSSGPCFDVVTLVLGPDAPGWLEAPTMSPTTSGGLLSLSDANTLLSRYTLTSMDDVCRMTCTIADSLAAGG